MPWPLLALAVAAFGIGTTEFVIMGLLPDLSRDFGVSISGAGMLVTGYALAVTFGAPLVAIATTRLPRKATLLGLMGVFVVGNMACALAPTYGLLMAARVLTALCHGAFFGIGSVEATNLVPRHQRSRAIALMFSGLTLANVIGVPFGTALGQALGWRATFWAIVPIGLAAGVAIAWKLPRQPAGPKIRTLAEFGALRQPQLLLAMVISMLASASLFSVLTYITPLLETVTQLTPHQVAQVLLLFGVGLTIGNLVGGRLADWRLMTGMIGSLIALVLILVVLVWTAASPLAAVAAVVLWGLIHFTLAPPLQTRVVDQAQQAPNLAATLNQSAFNFGNASGASIGGMALTAGLSYAQLPWVGAGIALLALGVAGISVVLERQKRATATRPALVGSRG
jgi:DHA1 family inner membrane transport protein